MKVTIRLINDTPPETPGLSASLIGTPVTLSTPAPIPGQWQFTAEFQETLQEVFA